MAAHPAASLRQTWPCPPDAQAPVRVSDASGVSGHIARMSKLRTLAIAAVAVLVAPALISGRSAPPAEQQAVRGAVARGEVLSLDKILRITERHVPGEVLKVELERWEKGLKYEVKVLAGTGRVREVELDARTGALIKIEND